MLARIRSNESWGQGAVSIAALSRRGFRDASCSGLVGKPTRPRYLGSELRLLRKRTVYGKEDCQRNQNEQWQVICKTYGNALFNKVLKG